MMIVIQCSVYSNVCSLLPRPLSVWAAGLKQIKVKLLSGLEEVNKNYTWNLHLKLLHSSVLSLLET